MRRGGIEEEFKGHAENLEGTEDDGHEEEKTEDNENDANEMGD